MVAVSTVGMPVHPMPWETNRKRQEVVQQCPAGQLEEEAFDRPEIDHPEPHPQVMGPLCTEEIQIERRLLTQALPNRRPWIWT